jgi:hypothetical protein
MFLNAQGSYIVVNCWDTGNIKVRECVRFDFLTWMFLFVSSFSFSEKLLSLLPEYVVPYTIHLLAHDPDYVKVQDIEQLKDVKE